MLAPAPGNTASEKQTSVPEGVPTKHKGRLPFIESDNSQTHEAGADLKVSHDVYGNSNACLEIIFIFTCMHTISVGVTKLIQQQVPTVTTMTTSHVYNWQDFNERSIGDLLPGGQILVCSPPNTATGQGLSVQCWHYAQGKAAWAPTFCDCVSDVSISNTRSVCVKRQNGLCCTTASDEHEPASFSLLTRTQTRRSGTRGKETRQGALVRVKDTVASEVAQICVIQLHRGLYAHGFTALPHRLVIAHMHMQMHMLDVCV